MSLSLPAIVLPTVQDAIAVIELVGALLAIAVFILLILAFGLAIVAAKRSSTSSRPVTKAISLREQLQQPRPRYYCFVDLEEVRRIYLQQNGEISTGREESRGTSRSRTGQIGAPAAGASGTSTQTAAESSSFDRPVDENLLAQLINDLVDDEQVGFGLESLSVDRAKVDILEECGRKLASIGAPLPESFMSRHSERLKSEGAPSKDEKCSQIQALCGEFTFLAVRGAFSVNLLDGRDGGQVFRITLPMPHGISVTARIPIDKVKPAFRHQFVDGATIGSLMMFGPHLGWRSTDSALEIVPLAIAASWTNN